jgi:glycosyltransferase involved in cell wall biosynthesis
MADNQEELVTVVVPAYNAADTIDETLLSVRAQTHAFLEIIVVDDGSTDASANIVERHRHADSRITLIKQPNSGVAAARNAAIAVGTGNFVAPVDADDLWHPRKIEKQIEAMRRGGAKVGLVYTWSALLDSQGRVTAFGDPYLHQGDVLKRLCEFNLVGNGSSPLMRTAAVRQAGGYDSSLLERNAQGCEDWALYLAIAEHFDFLVVPEFLTGYRRLPTSMSSDHAQMGRSFILIAEKWRARRPDLVRYLNEGMANMCLMRYRRAKASGRDREARDHQLHLIRVLPYQAFKIFVFRPLRNCIRQMITRRARSVPAGGTFPVDGPT